MTAPIIQQTLNHINFQLKELSKANEQLANKILPQIEDFGFLDRDEVYENI